METREKENVCKSKFGTILEQSAGKSQDITERKKVSKKK